MKERELWNAMRGIDPSYITDAAPGEANTVARKAPTWYRWATVAACLLILLCAIPISRQALSGFAPIGTGDETTGSYVNPINPDFVIEDGVLLNYTGDSPHVIIPDEVREISRDAFVEKGEIIETIYIGKNVETVDSLFLSEVKHLASIEVAEENRNYKYDNAIGVLSNAENSIIIDVEGRHKEGLLDMFSDTINEMIAGSVYNGMKVDLVIGRATITLSVIERDDYDPNGNEGNNVFQYDLMIDRIAFRGNIISGTENQNIHWLLLGAQPPLYLFQSEDILIIARVVQGLGHTYMITESEFFDLSTTFFVEEAPNSSAYVFNQREDGTIIYTRKPIKFITLMSLDEYMYGLQYGTGFDEFYKEEGYLSCENGGVVYHATQTYTLEEAGMHTVYADVFDQGKEEGWFILKDYDTIDELYAHNKEVYESAR